MSKKENNEKKKECNEEMAAELKRMSQEMKEEEKLKADQQELEKQTCDLAKKDQIENWIFSNDNYFFAFLGGYSDAEGNFGVYSGMARFRLGTYDKNILMQAADKLNKLGIITKFNLEGN